LTFPLLSDEGLTIAGGFGVRQEGQDIAVPATFVTDKGGVVRWEKVGDSPPHGHGPTVPEIVAAVGALPR
jgi:peroxiredoxin